MLKQYFQVFPIFVLITLIFFFKFPETMPKLGVILLMFNLAISIYAIFEKHKQTDKARIMITKDILIFITTFLLISFLGGLAGIFTNFYISNLFGAVVGFICAMLVALGIGYFVKWGTGKLIK